MKVEGKTKEQLFAERDATIKAILESINSPVFGVDRAYRYTCFNTAHAAVMKKLYGVEIQLGNSLLEYQSVEEDRKKAKQNLDRALRGEQFIESAYSGEESRSRRFFEVAHNAIRNEKDEVIGVSVFARDITERKQAVEALRESEEKYRVLFESLPIGIGIATLEGKVISTNPAMTNITGFDMNSWKAMRLGATYVEPNDRHKTLNMLHQYGRVDDVEVLLKRKDGSVYTALLNISMVNIDGKKALVTNIRDITQRKKTEELLRQSEQKYRLLLMNANDAVYVHEVSHQGGGTFVEVNDKACEMLGYTREEFLSMSVTDIDVPEHTDKKVPLILENLFLTKAAMFETEHLAKNGRKIPVEVSIRLFELHGKPTVLSVVRDITERKRFEEELQKAQRLESLGQLAGGIAHDFNNLMGGIFGYIDLALATSKDNTVSNYLSAAMGAIDRARNLTGQLLTFAKGGAPAREIGAVLPVISEATNLALSGSNIAAAYDFAEDLWLCNFDKNQICQVIDNVVINAQQAMPAGGTVSISARNILLGLNEIGILPAGAYVKISIADTGIGIAAENLQKVFDPFFTTKQKGSGLGLSICHSIVKKHNGWIAVESCIGKGSIFSIYLPASSEATKKTAPMKQASVHRGSGRILLMDDEATIQRSLEKILGMMGYSVECRSNGKDTLTFLNDEIASARSFTAIILDLTIPGGMGGKEVAVEIQKMNLHIPIFVASGYSNDPVMANPNKYGFTDSICKPFTIDEISELLNRHLVDNQ
jgi:two-component system cell cycle sensor histidine kinase/response regulator CckA